MNAEATSIPDVLENLTEKQLEVLLRLANGRTGKEIAFDLSISESAAVQRIETLRRKFGGIPRSDVARLGRLYLQNENTGKTWKSLTGNNIHLPSDGNFSDEDHRDQAVPSFELADSFSLDKSAPWAEHRIESLVPEVLDGENAVPARWLFVVAAAVLMAILLLVLLAVANAVGDLA